MWRTRVSAGLAQLVALLCIGSTSRYGHETQNLTEIMHGYYVKSDSR